MGVRTLPGNPDIALKLRKNARARRMTLRISRIDGSVTLTVPRGVSEREALAFAEEKQNWVRGHLARQETQQVVAPGMPQRDTRPRGGPRSSAGALMYSWRLVLAPRSVLSYVAAHEVAHLVEMNHSTAFWQVVHRLYGPHDKERAWLRREGPNLHRFRFEA